MKRLNPETGKPFKQGDVREDGYIFRGYQTTRIRARGVHKGFYKEMWTTPEKFGKRKERLRTNAKFFADYKLERGCFCCGYRDHPAALDFDHIDPKKKSCQIAQMASHSREVLMREIKKCIVLCANCHRIKTFDPQGFLKLLEMHKGPDLEDFLDEADLEYLHGH
jgi:5-methylcytosine-specific restriction endonuclease McrA